jgi:2-dehydro-3-deoxygluconokinase
MFARASGVSRYERREDDVSKSAEVWHVLQEQRLIALLNPRSPEQCIRAYETLAPLGVVLEVAMRGDAALPSIEAVLERHPDALLLAGTVLTRNQAEQVIAAGVAGVVSADYVPAVVDACVAHDVMCVPGGLADVGKQLVQKAERYDCTLPELRERRPWQWVYKVFPAMADESAVRETTRAWRSVYPGLTLVYTGGITLENVGRLARADSNGILCGSAVVRHADDPAQLRPDAERWLAAIRQEPASGPTEARAAREQARPLVVTAGEIMLRLSPPPGRRIRTATSYDATYGGAEANVAAALAQWGIDTRYVTALPANELGQGAVDQLRSFGVDTAHVVREGNRVGVYYLEHGASQRPSRVIYDRAHSAITEVQLGRIDWDAVFAGASWFHWTGITPALSESMAAVTAEATAVAQGLGITVSVDLNYRSRLWSKDRARAVMTPLVEQADVLVANEEDAANVFGIAAAKTDVERGELDVAAYQDVARQLVDRFDLRLAAITLRESHSASVNTWSACLWDGREFLHSTSYRVQLVDRVGGGDAFAAGLIRGLLVGLSHAEALEFSVAASCLKQTMLGDVAVVSVAEIEALMRGSGSGRIKR